MTDPSSDALEAARRTLRHDLRTPINHITNYAQLALEDAQDLGQTGLGLALESIIAAARNALHLVGQWLDPRLTTQAADAMRGELERTAQGIARRADQLSREGPGLGVGPDSVRDFGRIRDAARTLLAMMERSVDDLTGPSAEPAFDPEARLLADEGVGRARGGSSNVLVVDDDALNRDLLGRMLERLGHTVVYAENGRQALEVLDRDRIDMVLLDVKMPEVDGYQVLEVRRDRAPLRDIPFVMISGFDDVASVSRCIELGAEDYLPKPFDAVLLRARVGACLEKKRLRDQEVAYLHAVSDVAASAVAVEQKTFQPASIAHVAARADELGHLARVIQHMAGEVYAREERLTQQVLRLTVQVDEARKVRQVEEITSSAYFQELRERARSLRGRGASPEPELSGDVVP
jgi:two-component system, cell cycle response regulator